MTLEVPKYQENISNFELEEMIDPIEPREEGTFHTRQNKNYSPLERAMKKGKVKNN